MIHAAGSSLRSHRVLFSRCRQKNRGESTFSFTPQPPPLRSLPANTCTDSLSPSCLLTLRFIFRALWIEAAYFLRHTHTQSSHVCTRVHRYAWHARLVGNTHTHPYTLRGESTRGMAAMPKHWSDPGHLSFFKWNVSCSSVYFMRPGEAHHCESHHGERINTVPAEALHPAEHRGSRARKRLWQQGAWKLFSWSRLSHSGELGWQTVRWLGASAVAARAESVLIDTNHDSRTSSAALNNLGCHVLRWKSNKQIRGAQRWCIYWSATRESLSTRSMSVCRLSTDLCFSHRGVFMNMMFTVWVFAGFQMSVWICVVSAAAPW